MQAAAQHFDEVGVIGGRQASASGTACLGVAPAPSVHPVYAAGRAPHTRQVLTVALDDDDGDVFGDDVEPRNDTVSDERWAVMLSAVVRLSPPCGHGCAS